MIRKTNQMSNTDKTSKESSVDVLVPIDHSESSSSQNNEKLKTLDRLIHAKSLRLVSKGIYSELRRYFIETYTLYEALFTLIGKDEYYYSRPEPLRHPLIFYFGHTACVFVNKMLDAGLIHERVNPKFEGMFAVGVDEMDWDDLLPSHYDWPTVTETAHYRGEVRKVVLSVIYHLEIQNKSDAEGGGSSLKHLKGGKNPFNQTHWSSPEWVILMGIEHERVHLQTSTAIIRRLPIENIVPQPYFIDCPKFQSDRNKVKSNHFVDIPAYRAKKGRSHSTDTYGWDNEFGEHDVNVGSFKASAMLVSNAHYLEFVEGGGYAQPEWWTEEGKRWVSSIKPKHPLFWVQSNGQYKLRTVSFLVEMPWDWPVQVNNLEARAYCSWLSHVKKQYIRLPTEDEYTAIRVHLKTDHFQWEYQSVGNVNLQYWMSPCPVDMFKCKIGTQKEEFIYDVVGNVWQHTITPIYPFPGFKIHPIYEDFTTPTYDGRHDMIMGGSFISTGNESFASARYAFRRHFHQFAGIRYVTGVEEVETEENMETVTDKEVEEALVGQYLHENYVNAVAETVITTLKKQRNSVGFQQMLTIGCSVGRLPLRLARLFKHSLGIDYTARLFQVSSRIKEHSGITFGSFQICLTKVEVEDMSRTLLFQMNPENVDLKKIHPMSYVTIDGYALRQGRLRSVIEQAQKLMLENCCIFVVMKEDWNYLDEDEIRSLVMASQTGLRQILDVKLNVLGKSQQTVQLRMLGYWRERV